MSAFPSKHRMSPLETFLELLTAKGKYTSYLLTYLLKCQPLVFENFMKYLKIGSICCNNFFL